ncbi:MAG: hypothetical protein QOA62_11155, partial [Nitrososphaeraceae archaeon]|nr:hypothetical protein [Nitrososphaeraceae archaeon]
MIIKVIGAYFFQAILNREWIIPEASLNIMYLTPFSMTIKVKLAVTSIAVAVVVVFATVMIT